MLQRVLLSSFLVFSGLAISGCAQVEENAAEHPPVLFLNLTSDTVSDPHPVTMALQLAGHALDDGRDVVLFFNVKAVNVPTTDFPADLAFHDMPVAALLAGLIERGADVHVCPHCMEAMGISDDMLVEGAVVTDRERLFARLGPNTNVFTY